MKTNTEHLKEKLETATAWPPTGAREVVINRARRLLSGELVAREGHPGYWIVSEGDFWPALGYAGSAAAAREFAAAALVVDLNEVAPSPLCKPEPFGPGGDINKFARGGAL